MKKTMKKWLAGLLALTATFAFVACDGCYNPPKKGDEDEIHASLYVPDGAPALSVANMIEGDTEVNYHVVDAKTIDSFVTGKDPKADLCILPITSASERLGTGENYTMLATVTHGNLYLLSHDPNLQLSSASDFAVLKGKSVGVIQMQSVPGLTFRSILQNAEIPYAIGQSADENTVCLRAISDPANQIPSLGCDLYVAAEPLASLKVKKTSGTPKALYISGDLQTLYGSESGYPQAVLVVKNEFLNKHEDWVKGYLKRFQTSIESLNAQPNVEKIISALNGVRTEGMIASLNEQNLTEDVVKNCNVKFLSAKESKQAVVAYLERMSEINADVRKTVADKFFYQG